MKGVFLTGNAGTAHSQAMLWLIMANFALPSVATIIISGILVGIYWAVSTTLAAGVVDEVTDGGGFTVGHNQQVGIRVCGLRYYRFSAGRAVIFSRNRGRTD